MRISDRIRCSVREQAISTLVGVVLIIFLVVALSLILSLVFLGFFAMVEKTAYVVVDSAVVPVSPGVDAVAVLHMNGDVMYYENQHRDAHYEVRFMIDTRDGGSVVRTDPALISPDTTWSPGDRILIFRRVDGYYLTNNASMIAGAIPLPPGPVSVRVIDNTHHQLIAERGAGRADGPGPTGEPTTAPPTITPTTIPTTVNPSPTPTLPPTPPPDPVQYCLSCGPGEGFTVGFTVQVRGARTIRFKDDSSPQPNTRNWNFGDGGMASGELIDHTFPAPGTYQITLMVKKNNSPCTCVLTRWVTVT